MENGNGNGNGNPIPSIHCYVWITIKTGKNYSHGNKNLILVRILIYFVSHDIVIHLDSHFYSHILNTLPNTSIPIILTINSLIDSQIAVAWKPLMKKLGFWKSIRSMSRLYDAGMGMLIFIPIAFCSWFPFVSTFQTRLMFNQAFSRGLEISLILAGNNPNTGIWRSFRVCLFCYCIWELASLFISIEFYWNFMAVLWWWYFVWCRKHSVLYYEYISIWLAIYFFD